MYKYKNITSVIKLLLILQAVHYIVNFSKDPIFHKDHINGINYLNNAN